MNKVLITGGAGFLGYAVAKRLSEDPACEVVLVDNLFRGRVDADFEVLLKRKNVRFIEGDLTMLVTFATLPTDFNYVYHFAAVVGVKNVIEQPDRTLLVNALSTLYLYEYLKNCGALRRVIFSSTSEVYAGTLKHFGVPVPTPEVVPLCLDDISSSRSTYALSKMYGESVALNYERRHHVPSTIVRYHNIYGPRMGVLHVIPEMMHKICSHNVIDVASPSHTRAFCYVDDAVEATLLLATQAAACGEIFHVGNPYEEICIRDLVHGMAKILGKQCELCEGQNAPGSPQRRCPDISKLVRLTGFHPKVKLDEGLRRTCAWYAQQHDSVMADRPLIQRSKCQEQQ